MKKNLLYMAFLLVLMTGILTGCSTQGTQKTEEPKSLTWGETQAVASLDPAVDWQGWFTVRYAISETLFKLDDTLKPQPWLAKTYENLDPLTWKITLNENVKFSNGEALTPDMVVENLKRVGSLNKRAEVFKLAGYIVEGNSITIKTQQPYPTLINDLCDPYSSIILLKDGLDLDKQPIGTGAFAVKTFTEKEEIQLEANQAYWGGEPKLDLVTIKFITDTDTMAMALQSGEVDVAMNLTSDSKELFSDVSQYKIEEVASARAYYLYYNLKSLKDISVRKAIGSIIDKEGMKDYLFEGTVTPAVGAFPSQTSFGSDLVSPVNYSLETAKQLLSQAGYKDTDADGILDKEGKPLTVKIVTYKRLKNEAVVTELQSKLSSIGIKAEAIVHDNTDFLKSGDFDVALYSIVTTPVGDPQAFLEGMFSQGGITNYGGYENTQVSEALAQLKETYDASKRDELAKSIQQMALNDFAFDNVGFVNMAMYMKANVTGIKPHPTDYYQINALTDIE